MVRRSNQFIPIESWWKNTGVGIVLNNRPGWNGKYKVAFALFNPTTQKPVFATVTALNPAIG